MSLTGTSQKDINEIFESEAMRAEHTLGLDGDMEFQSKGKVITRQSTGNYSSTSMSYINENLDSFIPKLKPEDKNDWSKIKIAFTKAQAEARDGNPVDCVKNNLTRIRAGANKDSRELVHLGNSMWMGDEPHNIGITFYGNYMVVCDRGKTGGGKDCTKVYSIDPSQITNEQLSKLQSTPDDPKVILDTIKEISGNKAPIATFPSKLQKFGNCTYANRLTSIEPMHCLVKLDRLGKLNDEEIKAYSKDKGRKEYKSFTKHSRDAEATRLVSKLNGAKDNPELQAMYANLIIEIVKNRQKYISKMKDPEKIQTENMRNNKLIGAVAKIYSKIEDNITPANKSFYSEYLPKIPVALDAHEDKDKSKDIVTDILDHQDATFTPRQQTSRPKPSLESVVQQPATDFSKIKALAQEKDNIHHITKVEEQDLGFKQGARLKLEILAPTDAKPINVYVDDNGQGGVNYSLNEEASPEEKNRSIESICKLAVENSTKDTEFNLDNTPDEIKAEVKTALENAIKEKYKDEPEKAPTIKSSEEKTSRLKTG